MPEKDYTSVGGEARQLWEKGYECLEKKNFEYAMELLCMALEKDPAFFDCRMALRAAQVKKYEAAGRLAKMAAGATVATHLTSAKLSMGKKNFFAAMASAEKALCANPMSTGAHRILVDASKALDFPQTMISSLQMIKKANPKDKEITQELAAALEMLGDWDQAEKVMKSLADMNPDDPDLQQAYKDTAAKATIYRGNYESVVRGDQQLGYDEEAEVGVAMTAEEALEEKIYLMEEDLQDNPEDYKLAVEIAKLYVDRKDFERAFEYFDYVMENHTAVDSTIDRAIGDAHEARYNYDIEQYEASSPERSGLEAERDAYMLENARERADRYPTMLEFRYEYGERLLKAGQVNEAIQALQRAQNSPGLRQQSLALLGQCFMENGMYDMAMNQVEKALEGKAVMDDQKKELMYILANIYEKQGRSAEAAEQYKAIYEVDINFRDVSQKVLSGYSTGG